MGKAIALVLARKGASVVVDYVGPSEPAAAFVDQMNHLGFKAIAVAPDVSDPKQVDALVAAAVDTYGGLDILVNNAGMEQKHPFLETPFELFRKVIDIDLAGVWLCSQAAARQMVEQKRGGPIINISSVHEELPMPTNAPIAQRRAGCAC